MPARRASSTLVIRPSACSSDRMRRSIASRTGVSPMGALHDARILPGADWRGWIVTFPEDGWTGAIILQRTRLARRADAARDRFACLAASATDMVGSPHATDSRHARDPPHARPDHRLRPGRLHRGDLRRARQPVADPGGRAAAGRAAHDHHRRRELPGLRRRHPGALADGADGGAGRACRHAHRARPDHPGGLRRPPVPLRRRLRATSSWPMR